MSKAGATAENAIVPISEGANGALTPMDMLNRAVMQGADIEVLEKLMALQERWEKNQARKDFDEAVAAAKAKIKPVARSSEGHNRKKYADFAAIARAVDPVIAEHGLSYRFRTTQDDRIHVTCILSHRSGHSEETTLAGPPDQTGNKNAIQAIGSTLTYLQRYSLVQMLGLAASDDDDDGRAAAHDTVVTDQQADEIRALLTETKSDLNRFLAWVGAESVSDIPAAKYPDCVTLLKAKQQKSAPK
jgi:hypothetical protein